MLVFENIGLLSFDYPYRQLFDNNDKRTQAEIGESFNFEKSKSQDCIFIDGGPIRIFIYMILQGLNQLNGIPHKFDILMQMMRFLILHEPSQALEQMQN